MPIYEFGRFTLDTTEHLLRQGSERIPLTAKVFAILEMLVEAGGRMVDRETFQAKLWPDAVVEERNLTVNVSTLRKALHDDTGVRYIETIPKLGYRLTVPVKRVEAAAPAPLLHSGAVAIGPVAGTEVPTPSGSFVADSVADRHWMSWSGTRYLGLRGGLVVSAMIAAVSIAPIALWRARETRLAGNAAALGGPRIAVLPFAVAGESPEDSALGLGLADAVISRLAGIEGISVRPISAVMPFANGGDPVAIGQSLQADRVIEGVIQHSGTVAKVTTRIVDVTSGATSWTERFEKPYTGFFELQDAVSAAVAGSLMQRVVVERQWRNSLRRPASPDAYRAYLEARMLIGRLNAHPPSVDEAIQAYRRSLALDQTFAPAWSGLARAYRVRSFSHETRRDALVKLAYDAIARALALDPLLPEAHLAHGMMKYNFEWDWIGAERDMQRAVDLAPDDEDALSWLGNVQRGLGKHEEALRNFERARRVNPIGARHIQIMGEALWYAGRIDDAVGMLEQAGRLNPADPTPHWLRAAVLDSAGRGDEAIAPRRQAAQLTGDAEYLAGLDAMRSSGYRAVLEFDVAWRTKSHDFWEIAALQTQLGRRALAIDALEQCVAANCANVPVLVAEPRFRPLFGEPRFQALAARVHLAEVLTKIADGQ